MSKHCLLCVADGDIHAVTTLERAVALVVMLIGVLFFGYVISSLSRLIEVPMSLTSAMIGFHSAPSQEEDTTAQDPHCPHHNWIRLSTSPPGMDPGVHFVRKG